MNPAPKQEAALQFGVQPHPHLHGVSLLTFAVGPMMIQVGWPTAELFKLVSVLKDAADKAPKLVVPVPGVPPLRS